MTKRELIKYLESCPDEAEIIMIYNTLSGNMTYAAVDYVVIDKPNQYITDIMDTPGDIDKRLLKLNESCQKIAVIGTTCDFI